MGGEAGRKSSRRRDEGVGDHIRQIVDSTVELVRAEEPFDSTPNRVQAVDESTRRPGFTLAAADINIAVDNKRAAPTIRGTVVERLIGPRVGILQVRSPQWRRIEYVAGSVGVS